MLHFQMSNGQITQIVSKYSDRVGDGWINRHDFDTYEAAVVIAGLAGDKYIAIDNGEYVSPRYDVIEAPQVGDLVSYAFNGDSYPDGTITSISKSLKIITTSSGRRYYRRKLTGTWKYSKTWSLVHGHHHKRNPEL